MNAPTDLALEGDFRAILRSGTADAHDGVDALFSTLVLSDPRDFARFCRIHIACFDAMLLSAPLPAMRAARTALAADLAALEPDVALPVPRGRDRWAPLAVAYVFGGSRMGTRVLAKRWSSPLIAGSAYFNAAVDSGAWRETCEALGRVAPGSPDAACILSDTRAIFARFAESYRALT